MVHKRDRRDKFMLMGTMGALRDMCQLLIDANIISKADKPDWQSVADFTWRMNKLYELHDLPKRRTFTKN